MRSVAQAANSDEHVARSRSSKVQNQDVRVVLGGTTLPFYTELVALMRKDAAIIAASIFEPLKDLVAALRAGLSM